MKRLSGKEIRQTWIKFFEEKGHKEFPSVSLVPVGDKSLLWVNAGVTGLKKYFDGSLIPPSRRIVNIQKCIRTNDIENVGHTARHHTFFEMLGNFSIGDYFRNEVIPWAFEILTTEKGYEIPPEKLYVTYNPADKATLDLWVKCGIDPNHMIPLEGNYWEIGEGPCGPDTEIFFDRGEKYDPKHLGDKLLRDDIENDRYIEIWNIVFSQYNSVAGVARKDYKELPSKNIDTGSGLERIACILQGTETNFETDLFMPIINAAIKLANKPYEGENLMAYRVIADHARCLSFALSDGAYFSNEGRGYVLRRIIRRAMRYGQKLGIMHPFMYELVDVVVDEYSASYPNLATSKEFIKKMIRSEEEKFLKTLSSGEAMLRDLLKDHKDLKGEEIFKLYDTYGFPKELTLEIVEENGGSCDMEGFQKCMEEQKERARKARGEIESFAKQSKDLLEFKDVSNFDYGKTELEGKVIGLFQNGVKVDSIDEEGEIIFDKTPFYSESGGQVSDAGSIQNDSCEAKIIAMSKAPNGAHLHHVEVAFGSIKLGDSFQLSIDSKKRALTARNHSATHLLHAALCEVLGEHVDQKGSFVNEDYLRFDFTSLRGLTSEEKEKIESIVNEKIAEAIPEVTHILPIEEAKKLGAEMEFSEKYGDVVRVVTFGEYSKEFCGGTHVSNTQDIGCFIIEEESAISSGVRRIQGRTSLGAIAYLSNKRKALDSIESLLGGVSDKEVITREKGLIEEKDACKKEISALNDKLSASSAKSMVNECQDVNGIKLLVKYVKGENRENLIRLGDALKNNVTDYVYFLVGGDNGNYPLLALCGGKGIQLGAGKLVKEISSLLEARGGGKPESASGSAKSIEKLSQVETLIKERI